jgi:hypothetical protein
MDAVAALLEAVQQRFSKLGRQQHRHEQRARVEESPLENNVIVDIVFSYVGIGDYFYTAAVCRNWRGRYITLCNKSTRQQPHKLCTAFKSAVMTRARLELALEDKLTVVDLQKDPYAMAQCVVAQSLEPQTVLEVAKSYDMQWSTFLTREAAYHKRPELLKWLHRCGCPTDLRLVIRYAIYRDSVDILAWARSIQRAIWDVEFLNRSLVEAGRAGSVAAAAWLRSLGAEWPVSFAAYTTDGFLQLRIQCWEVTAVKWAVANGCTWGAWQCQDLADDPLQRDGVTFMYERLLDWQTAASVRRRAAELFTWAHENGCPCTCAPVPQQQQQLLLEYQQQF